MVEDRGRFYTGLDGCLRLTNRRFDLQPTEKLASAWLAAGCASSYEVCPAPPSSAICLAGACREKPPAAIAEDWLRVDIEEALTVFLPPDVVELPYSRTCGNGPAVRAFRGPGLEVRFEYGYDPSYLPLGDDGELGEPLPVRLITRAKRKIGGHDATVLMFERPLIGSKSLAPDGSWPSYGIVRALSLKGLDDRLRSGFLGLGQGTGPVSFAIIIEGERARDPVASRILDTLTLW